MMISTRRFWARPSVVVFEAIEWQTTRGSRSGRVAWQFFTDLAARHGVRIIGRG